MKSDPNSCCEPDCCLENPQDARDEMNAAVRDAYASTARSSLTNDSAGVQAVAEAFGYSREELTSIPAEANMGLSCGNPTATAHLKAGEVVVDLGSGGGLDVFLASKKVGSTGRAIGIDMTPEMVDRARAAAARGVEGIPFDNVEFHLAPIDQLPLPDGSVDVIISNCVINLAADKSAVFEEMFRVLKPGGRVAVSDIALRKALPKELADSVAAFVGCIAGAIPVADYEAGLRDAGFAGVTVVDAKSDLNAYSKVAGQAACCSPSPAPAKVSGSACCSGSSSASVSLTVTKSACCTQPDAQESKAQLHEHLRDIIARHDVNEFAASVKVFAIKPV